MQPIESNPELLDRQARRLVASMDALFFEHLMRKHADKNPMEEELLARDMRAITVLGQQGSFIMSDFAQAVGIPLSTATHMVDRLESKGLVARVRSTEDRRMVRVELSREGRQRERTFLEQRLAMGREMLAPLSSGERELFLELLVKMVDSIHPETPPVNQK